MSLEELMKTYPADPEDLARSREGLRRRLASYQRREQLKKRWSQFCSGTDKSQSSKSVVASELASVFG